VPINKKKYYSSFLKEEATPEFGETFKDLVFRNDLSYGTRIFLISLMSVPRTSEYSNRKLGKRLNVAGKQIRLWRQEAEIKKVQVSFRPLA